MSRAEFLAGRREISASFATKRRLGPGMTAPISSSTSSSHPTTLPLAYPLTTAPPLTWIDWPETKLPSWLARKTYAGPSSDGWPIRPMGAGDWCHSFIWSLSIAAGCSGVHTGPGQTYAVVSRGSFRPSPKVPHSSGTRSFRLSDTSSKYSRRSRECPSRRAGWKELVPAQFARLSSLCSQVASVGLHKRLTSVSGAERGRSDMRTHPATQ